MADDMDERNRTLFCGNLEDRVTEDILFELFLQAGPLERVKMPLDNASGRKKGFAFVTFKHDQSVPYTLELMNGIQLYGKPLKLQTRQGSSHQQNQGNFNRSMSAPQMGHFTRDQQNFGTSPVHMQRGQTYGGGPSYQPNVPSPLLGNDNRYDDDRSRQRGNDNDHRGRRYDRSDSSSRHRDGSYDDRRNRNDNRNNDRYNRNNDRDRSNDRHSNRDRNYDNNRGRNNGGRDRSHDRNRSGGFDTPPHPTRMDSNSGSNNQLPMMSPAQQPSIDQRRMNLMAMQQKQLQFMLQVQQQQQQQQQFHSQHRGHSGRYQGRR